MSSGFFQLDSLRLRTGGFSSSQFRTASAGEEATAGETLAARGQFPQARARYVAALRLEPNNARFHWLMAHCEWGLGDDEAAGRLLHDAVRLDPNLACAQSTLAEWYLIHGMVNAAMQASATAYRLTPNDLGVISSRGVVLEAAGELDAAWDLVQQAVARNRMSSTLALLFGRMARRRGNQDRALECVERFLKSDTVSALDKSSLHLIAGDLLDGLGRYDEAFAHAVRGNQIRKPKWDAADHSRAIDERIAYFTREKVQSLPKATDRDPKPVFIMGMLRSGTSLVEQILASHPKIHGAGELDLIYWSWRGTLDMLKASEDQYPQCMDRVSIDQLNGMAQIYLGPLGSIDPSAERITDKMPTNFMLLGFIASLLPGARVIHCHRDPLDTCLSCYMTSFSVGNGYKYDLADLGTFYRDYERLMDHWKSVLDIQILDVRYEDVVADPEGQSKRMLNFLGMPWDERCGRFHETKRSVATASVQQVRRPIYKSSLARWRNYEKHLGPLKTALDGMCNSK